MRKNYLKYPVEFVRDVFGEGKTLAAMLEKAGGGAKPKLMIVADLNVVQRHASLGSAIGRWVQTYGFELAGQPVVLAAGEKVKMDSFRSMELVMNAVLSARLSPQDAVIVIGGGSLFDLVGYVAPQVRGGVGVLRIPTTPAAMLDAVYSEYGALNVSTIKDALKVPCRTIGAVVDCSFATTVMDGVWNGGFGEATRLAAAADKTLFALLEAKAGDYRERKLDSLEEIARSALAVRSVKGDAGYAEWSAVRLEAMSDYKLPHGYAIPLGVMVDAAYAEAKGQLKPADRERISALLTACGANEGCIKSRCYLLQTDELLQGLDAWALVKGIPEISTLTGVGKSALQIPDRELYRTVLTDMAK